MAYDILDSGSRMVFNVLLRLLSLYAGQDFLRKRALPFMEQSALFYEDFLIEGNNGKLVFCPSYSPENNPLNSPSQACINATMEIMGVNALLRAIIDASKILNVNQNKITKWESMLTMMPEYELNENGEIREWLWKDLKDNHEHRHASQLFGLYDLHDPVIMNSEELKNGCKRQLTAEWKPAGATTVV